MDINTLITDLYNEGLGDSEIAKELNVSHSHIRHIRQFKLNLPNRRSLKRIERHNEIQKLYDQGMSDPQIAKTLGLSKSAVQWNRKDHMKLPTLNPELVYETVEDRIRGYMIRNIKFTAKRRGLEFNLSYKDLTLVNNCPILGIPLKYMTEKGFNDNDRATIDRIDNTKGYIRGNVWILSRLANTMKNEASLDQLELFCNNTLQILEDYRARGSITDPEGLDS